MAGFMKSVKNLWNVPEEFENDGYENENRNHKASHREKRNNDETQSRRNKHYNEASYDEDYSYNNVEDTYTEKRYSQKTDYTAEDFFGNKNSNKVLNINATTRLQVVLFKPTSFGNDVTTIAEELKKSHTVLLNFEETPRDESKRIVDFICGCAFFSDGKVQRVAKNIFLITPNDVEFIGNSLLDELQSNGLQIDY